jgi:phenylalanyl-tRNA synthetase alpha chain
MVFDLESYREEALKALKAINDNKALNVWHNHYLGKQSQLGLLNKELKNKKTEERKTIGKEINKARGEITRLYADKRDYLDSVVISPIADIDISLPPKGPAYGFKNPLTLVEDDLIKAFEQMGFSVVTGPDIETEYYNFDALNIPEEHPAREMWDTIWINGRSENLEKKSKSNKNPNYLLRTHTSPLQIRYMENHKPPFKMVALGATYRYEALDATHEVQFHQMEGLMIDKNINLGNLKYVLEKTLGFVFKNPKIEMRLRPSFFPFVTPGVEMDMSCFNCHGDGCNICGHTGWIEICGAGMVHPKVLEKVGINSKEWQGFAFGLGLERIAMLKYGITDIRLFHNPDLRLLRQF